MHNITLRPAIASDRPLIWKLILQNNLNIWGLRWENFIVAVDEQDQFVGCGQIKRHGSVEELASLIVVDEWQGRGISRLLMDALLERAKRPVWLMCESSLVRYYSKSGFDEVTEPINLPSYFRNLYWVTRVLFGAVLAIRGTYVAFMALREY